MQSSSSSNINENKQDANKNNINFTDIISELKKNIENNNDKLQKG